MSEWISVKDRLPETSYWALVTDGKNVCMADYDIDAWVGIAHSWVEEITHWMPFPQPPQDTL